MINISNQVVFKEHRSGWAYAINALLPLHSDDGILFDGFLENTFAWSKFIKVKNNVIPYTKPWIGFIHNPHNMPFWFDSINSPQSMFACREWIDSIKHCKGLYCLSEYLSTWVRQQFPWLLVETIYHPTETPDIKFDLESYLNNKEKSIIQLGWWLRKLDSIYRLPACNHNKIRLLGPNERVKVLDEREKTIRRLDPPKCHITGRTRVIKYLKNDAYDKLLANNICFIDLYDSSANNAVIECIVRNTPVVVKRHPAVMEYLGTDYPLYFDNLEEAAALAANINSVVEAYYYLTNMNKEFLSADYFLDSVMKSSIYSSLC